MLPHHLRMNKFCIIVCYPLRQYLSYKKQTFWSCMPIRWIAPDQLHNVKISNMRALINRCLIGDKNIFTWINGKHGKFIWANVLSQGSNYWVGGVLYSTTPHLIFVDNCYGEIPNCEGATYFFWKSHSQSISHLCLGHKGMVGQIHRNGETPGGEWRSGDWFSDDITSPKGELFSD